MSRDSRLNAETPARSATRSVSRRRVLGALTGSASVVGCLRVSGEESPTAASRPIQAHRCFSAAYPENTVSAAVQAAEVATQLEFDVRRCGSGELVVFHDERVDRLTGATGPVSEFDLADLRKLHVLGSGEPIPLLSEMLEAIPAGRTANIELKEPGLAAEAIELGVASDLDVVVSSLQPAMLAEVNRAPNRGAVETALVGVGVVGERFTRGITSAVQLGCDRVHVGIEHMRNGDAISLARANGLWVNSSTLRSRRRVQQVRRMPVDGLSGDRPGIFE